MVSSINLPYKQKGMTLLVALVTLVVLMLLGVAAMNASNTMFKLAGNLQYENEAKNRAESALAAAEGWLLSGTNATNAGFTTSAAPYYSSTASFNPLTNWPAAASAVATNEQFVIQRITATKVTAAGSGITLGTQASSLPATYHLYRVTARGRAARGAERYLEAIVQVAQ
jgi:type IV pilus assembly protein PilX